MLSTPIRWITIVVVAAAAVPAPMALLGLKPFGALWLVFAAAVALLVALSRPELRMRVLGGAALAALAGAGAPFLALVAIFWGLCNGSAAGSAVALVLGGAVYLGGTCFGFARGRALVWVWPAALVAGYAVGLLTLALAGAHGSCGFS
jgi:hypothetical protein